MKCRMLIAGVLAVMSNVSGGERDYSFDGRISREVLENYLARSITMAELSHSQCFGDDLRMIRNIRPKFIGRFAFLWGHPGDDEAYFRDVKAAADRIHEADPGIVLQSCIFEAIFTGVDKVPVPAWVFEEFGLKPEQRRFSYKAMLFDDGTWHDRWGRGASVPDMSKLETRMWFFYRARRYIDAGCEAIHFGQVMLMNRNDRGNRYWMRMLSRCRRYAAKHARRHLLLCDAHTHGEVSGGKLLFDFHSFPLRIKSVKDHPQQGALEVGHIDSIFRRSKGGICPSGWKCDSLPYIAEVDNWGSSGRGGQFTQDYWCWSYDEICWFARQPEAYRNGWLRYAWKWIRENAPNGYLQMPGTRCLSDPANGQRTYWANTRSDACPGGFGQEETIKAIWDAVE